MKKLLLLLIVLLISSVFAEIVIEGRLDGFTNMQAAYHYDGLVYILSGRDMVIVNPMLPEPSELGRISFEGYAMELIVDDSRAYVVQGNELSVVDVTFPMMMSELAVYDLSNYGFDIAQDGEYLYVAALDAMDIFQRTGPDAFELIHSIPSTGTQCKSVAIWDNFLLMGKSESGMSVYDITTPDSPTLSGTANTPGWVLDIEVEGDMAYIADGSFVGVGDGSVVQVDLSTRPMYSMVDTLISPGGNAFEGTIAFGDYYILADGSSIMILDISDPSSEMTVLDDFAMETGLTANNVDFDGEFIYVAASTELLIMSSDELVAPEDTEAPIAEIIQPVDGSASSCISQRIEIEIEDDSAIDWTTAEFEVDGYTMTGMDVPHIDNIITYSPMIEWSEGSHAFALSALCDEFGNCIDEPVNGEFLIDYTAPIVLSVRPEDGGEARVEDPIIQAELYDSVGTIDPSSIVYNYEVDGVPYTAEYPDDVAWDGEIVTLTSAESFEDGAEVRMGISFSDDIRYCDAHTTEYSWSFTVSLGGSDVTPPTAILIEPPVDSYISNPSQQISYEITDESGVDPSSIELTANTMMFTIDDPELTFIDDILTLSLTSDWTEGEENVVILEQYADLVGNYSSTPIVTRFTADYTAPYIAWTYPEPGDSDISSTTSIQVAVNESGAGLDTDVIEMTINGELVDPIFSPVPGDTGKVITYMPTDHYSSVTVEVCVNNIADKIDLGEANSIDTCFSFTTDDIKEQRPENIAISNISPNPFNSALAIDFYGKGHTNINAYDIDGRFVESIYNGIADGQKRINWQTNSQSGIYLIHIETGDAKNQHKALLIR